ncbi:MAG: hypothetical protein IT439_06170 [Phycisphaerales bacterium]|nr:hypothetical protein [Phycisphaerales bacterium]
MRINRDGLLATAFGLVIAGGVAMATEWENPTGPTTPGWQYGQQHCNPANNDTNDPDVCTEVDCDLCCQLGYDNEWLTQTERGQCYSYCAAIYWPNIECENES